MDDALSPQGRGRLVAHALGCVAYGAGLESGEEPDRELVVLELDPDAVHSGMFSELITRLVARSGVRDLDHAWVAWSFPDLSGTIIAWALPDGLGGILVEIGLAAYHAHAELAERAPARLGDIAQAIVPTIDNDTCLAHFGRVFSIRERWHELIAEHLLSGGRGALKQRVAPGYSIAVRACDAAPLPRARDEDFVFVLGRPAGSAGTLGESTRAHWLAPPLAHLAAKDLVLEAYLSSAALVAEWERVARRGGLALRRRPEAPGHRVELANELGLAIAFDVRSVLRRALADGHSLGEQAQIEDQIKGRILLAQTTFMRELPAVLPAGFSALDVGRDGRLRIAAADHVERIIDLWLVPLEYDLDDDEDRRRFLAYLDSGERDPGGRPPARVEKELHSRRWLAEREARLGATPPLAVLRAHLAEVFTLVRAAGEVEPCPFSVGEAQARWLEGLADARFRAQAAFVRVGRLVHHRVLVVAGPGIANAVLDPRLVRGLLDAAGWTLERRAHVFAPRSGILVISDGRCPQADLRLTAYRFFIDYARDRMIEMLGDTLHFRARLDLPPPAHGLGRFDLTPLTPPWPTVG